MTDQAIRTDGLSKLYKQVPAVEGLDLRVPPGAVYGFLGRNGAGKTTTLRMLMGLNRPTRGSISVLGMSWPNEGLAILEQTAYMPEKKILFDYLTGNDLLRFNRGFFPKWSTALAAKYVQRLEIPMNQRFKDLSLGNQTKLCLLLALSQGAQLLILDEPTAGLDPVSMDELLQLLIEDYASEGRTIFMASHNLTEVEKIADWVGIIDKGKLLLQASLEDIRDNYRRISASGNDLPMTGVPQLISARTSESVYEYHVQGDSDRFVANLRSHSATILEVSRLNLEQVFLQLVRKEGSCTSGNSGATRAAVSIST